MKIFCKISFLLLLFNNAVAQVNLTAGLVAYYPFTGNSLDASGNGNNATNFGATLTNDQFGNPNSAYLFNGTSNYMSVANSPTLQTASITLCAKVKPNAFYNGPCYNNSIIDRGNGGYNPGSISLTYTPSLIQNPAIYCVTPDTSHENYRIDVNNSATPSLSCITPVNAIPYVDTVGWDCVIGIFNDTTLTGSIYVNGIFRYSYTLPSLDGAINSSTLFLGTNSPSYPYFVNGVMDEIRIYNRAINLQEVQALCGCVAAISGTASPTIVCQGNFTTLSGGGASNYIWTGSVSNGLPFVPLTTSTYTVTGTDANGCTGTSTVTVNVVNNLTINISPSNPILCIGDSVQLTATGAVNYSWWPNTDISNTNIPDPIVYPSTTTTYFVTGTDASGCSGSASVQIEVVQFPTITATKSGDVECNIHTIQLSATGTTTYSWSPATFLSAPNSAVTNAVVNVPTTFIVTGTIGSCVVTDSVHVDVFNDDEATIYIPNAFSPNGDGLNECLSVRHGANFIKYYFAIYNRWGQRVFETESANDCWDGNFKNKPAALATYYFFLEAETRCGKIFKKGDITLIR